MSGGAHLEVMLAVGYAVFLACVAFALELLARHTRRRAEQYHVAGFKYHHGMDAWECPTGQHLHRHHGHDHRIRRYRAPAHVCNGCHLKQHCTDSDEGRSIERAPDLWLETEIGRFHRGISLALLLLAQFICGVEYFRLHSKEEHWLLAALAGIFALCWTRMLANFRATSRRSG